MKLSGKIYGRGKVPQKVAEPIVDGESAELVAEKFETNKVYLRELERLQEEAPEKFEERERHDTLVKTGGRGHKKDANSPQKIAESLGGKLPQIFAAVSDAGEAAELVAEKVCILCRISPEHSFIDAGFSTSWLNA